MATLLDVQNLSISFRTYRGILAATHDVTLHVDAGETVGIVGESGCGKSVTAHAVMRLLPAATTIYSSGTAWQYVEACSSYGIE